MKRKKRNKEIDYAVKYLYEIKKMNPIDIATELGLEEAVVDGIINQPKEGKKLRPSKSQSLMINKTAVKKINSVSVMTEAASQNNDEFMKKMGATNSRTSVGSIHRPND